MQDVHRWIMWLVKEKRLEYAAEHMHVFYKLNGAQLAALCDNYQKMSTHQNSQLGLTQRVMIEAVCAHLDIWKSAAQTIGCGSNSPMHSKVCSDDNGGLQITSGILSSVGDSLPNGMQMSQRCNSQQLADLDLLPYDGPQTAGVYGQGQQGQHQYVSSQHLINASHMSQTRQSAPKYGAALGEMHLNGASATCHSAMYPTHSSPPMYTDPNDDTYSDGKDGPSSEFESLRL